MSWSCFHGLFKNAQAPSQWWLPLIGGRVMPGLFLVSAWGVGAGGLWDGRTAKQSEACPACLLELFRAGEGRQMEAKTQTPLHYECPGPRLLPPKS